MNTKGHDLPAWLLWVSIDYTTVSQLSGATGAEHSHVLWCFFFERSNIWPNPSLSHALAPAGALLSAVHFSMCTSASGSGFSELPLGAVRSSRQCIWTGSWICWSFCARASSEALTGWLPSWYDTTWVHVPSPWPSHMSSYLLCPPQGKLSVDFLCWQARRDHRHGAELSPLSRALK